jgi:hypothetical protein
LIRVEPVGAEEHWEEKEHKRLDMKSCVQAEEFGFPGGILDEDYAGGVGPDYFAGVDLVGL